MIYIVTFDIKQPTHKSRIVYHCEARNAKEACQIAKEKWPLTFRSEQAPKQTHLHAVRSAVQNPALLRVISWRGDIFNGRSCFDFLCCESTRR